MVAHDAGAALAAAWRPAPAAGAAAVRWLVVGAVGKFGGAALRELAGRHAAGAAPIALAVRRPMAAPLRAVQCRAWHAAPADCALLVFDRPAARGREAALEVWSPAEAAQHAAALRALGVRRLLVLHPQDEASLPGALAHGALDAHEQALLTQDFEAVWLLRPARRAAAAGPALSLPERLAGALLQSLKLMIPRREQALAPRHVGMLAAELAALLPRAPGGVRIAAAAQIADWIAAAQPAPARAPEAGALSAAMRAWAAGGDASPG